MTNEQRLAALAAEVEALEAKIDATRIIKLLENKQEEIYDISFGNKSLGQWFHFWRTKPVKDRIESERASLGGYPPQKLRDDIAKVFREHYGIEETQDDK